MIKILNAIVMKEFYFNDLLKYEAINQLIIANLLMAIKDEGDMLFGIISEANEVKCFFNNNPPFACCINDINPLINSNSEKYGAELVKYFDDHDIRYYGVNASKSISDGFVKNAKKELKFDIGMDVMELKEVNNYQRDGISSIMSELDIESLADMYIKFELECLNKKVLKEEAINKFRNLYNESKENVFKYEVNGKIVSMCLATRALINGRSINGVYTIESERGKGYCKAMMSDISKILLERGNKYCTLYVDKANPFSNRAYLSVGYHSINECYAYKEKKKIKCIVSDLDGTLLYGHGTSLLDLTQRNDEAIKKCLANDIKFLIASGRTQSYGVKILEQYYETKDIVVAGLNGGVIYDHGELVRKLPIAFDDAMDIMNLVKAHRSSFENFQIQAINEIRYYLDMSEERMPFYISECKELGIGGVCEESIESYLSKDNKMEVGKLLIITKGIEQTEIMHALVEKKYGDKYIYTRSSPRFVEINHKEASKGNFIKYLMNKYNYDIDEIAVIGDSLNDMSMLKEVENSFSMKHGEQALIDRAKYVVEDVAKCVDICINLNSN